MLVNQHHIPIWVRHHKARGPLGALVGLGHEGQALAFEVALDGPHIVKMLEDLGVFVPAGVEGQDIAGEHPLEEPHQGVAVFHDEVLAFLGARENVEPEVFIKSLGGLEVFYAEGDGEGAEVHDFSIWR